MAVDIKDYGTLKTAIGDFLVRGDLVPYVPYFVKLLEADLRKADFERTIEMPFTLAAEENDLPADFRRPVEAYYAGPTIFGNFDIGTASRLGAKLGDRAGIVGIPVVGAVIDSNGAYKLRVAPAPDSPTAYVIRLIYDARLTPLDPANDTSSNWLIQNHPDVYLYGSLIHTAPFLKDDDRLTLWQKLYDGQLEKLRVAHQKQKYGSTPLVIKPRRALGG